MDAATSEIDAGSSDGSAAVVESVAAAVSGAELEFAAASAVAEGAAVDSGSVHAERLVEEMTNRARVADRVLAAGISALPFS
ncbi:hypothetical protein [uncultured Serinicoccus sp.]|uniref:hypothetical protein n=1 Tax=uncultured Serinicoccus sp. TaxID=735514 RepID=UPI0026306319|nr:hypothetical protein [uncultured Serinicoccus sp.]